MPIAKEYINDEKIVEDVKKLKEQGINHSDIYILSHDDDRTERIADNAKANTIGFSEQDMKKFVENMFNKKGDELRTKLQEIGFDEDEAEEYEEDMDEGKVLLIVKTEQPIEMLLQ